MTSETNRPGFPWGGPGWVVLGNLHAIAGGCEPGLELGHPVLEPEERAGLLGGSFVGCVDDLLPFGVVIGDASGFGDSDAVGVADAEGGHNVAPD